MHRFRWYCSIIIKQLNNVSLCSSDILSPFLKNCYGSFNSFLTFLVFLMLWYYFLSKKLLDNWFHQIKLLSQIYNFKKLLRSIFLLEFLKYIIIKFIKYLFWSRKQISFFFIIIIIKIIFLSKCIVSSYLPPMLFHCFYLIFTLIYNCFCF